MRTLIILLAILLFVYVFAWVAVDVACAQPRDTLQVMYEILAERGSPLADEAYTVVAWRRTQGPDADMLSAEAVMWAETNLGRDSFWRQTFNAGCIRGGSVGSFWRDSRISTWGDGFNVYASPRDGQRALLRLLTERGYLPLLKAHDWRGFTRKYWGGDYYTHVAHRESYIADLAAAYRHLVEDGKRLGLNPVHLQ